MRLSAGELSIGYRDHLVGSGVDLALTAGEVLGQNGAGKTTLFRTLPGLNPALGGAVLLDEKIHLGPRTAPACD
jgi:iron-chelate-transporting ATPase